MTDMYDIYNRYVQRPFLRSGGVILVAIVSALLLSSCSDFKRAIGSEKSSPDEFEVVIRPSLSLPPHFKARPSPADETQPTGASDFDAVRFTSALLSARTTTATDINDVFAFDLIVPDIRTKIDEETAGIIFERRLPIHVLFGGLPHLGPVLDKLAEDRRIRRAQRHNKAITAGATPAIDEIDDQRVFIE